MTNLLSIYDTITNGYMIEFLDNLTLIALFFGVMVISIKNPIASLFSLIGLFGGVSIYLILLKLNFIGLSYLIVYIGAVSILFLFILMLINVRISELLIINSNTIPLAFILTIWLSYGLLPVFPYYLITLNSIINNNLMSIFRFIHHNQDYDFFHWVNNNLQSSDSEVLYATSNNWDGNMVETTDISAIGNILYTSFSIWLIIASFILLLAMVGAILISLRPQNQQNQDSKGN